MKLDRNLHADGRGKYELRNLRTGEIVSDCGPGEEHEFFVIMLKDRNAVPALTAYARSAQRHDEQWAEEVFQLAERAAVHPMKKDPD